MKYAEKIENFISELDTTIPFNGYQCCGNCAKHEHNTQGYTKSFWISSDDLDNKASQGVDLNFINFDENDMAHIVDVAMNNQLSFFLSTFSDSGFFRIGVYSKRGKPEIKVYNDGKEVINK